MRKVNRLAKRLKKIQEVRTPDGIVILASSDWDANEKLENTRAKSKVVIIASINSNCPYCDIHFDYCKCDYSKPPSVTRDVDETEGLLKWIKGDVLYTRLSANMEAQEQDLSGLSPIVREVLTKDAVTLH
ncbi:hypothetical protein P4I85_29265 [Bacillus cereus]|uniref:hypothetical protein n=1 Tax=Bacillus thuringiensis TaxID=1428 RepID=UPI000A3B5467|nr:hypothetical protein [Bacillus thuringiensis]MDA2153063.1 hypothetical protein [Bacillus cereus]MDA2561855.1 hypothetical protein [Bacillus cereus]MDA2615972.1 hypothetical protein [Bacillus cereus]MEB9163950.1 hypothetical protein [Bacillus cereus]MEB9512809.1 hypothetical protein [Bacillus cereus]